MSVYKVLRSLLSSASWAVAVTLLTLIAGAFFAVLGTALLTIVVACIVAGGLGFAVVVAAIPMSNLLETKETLSEVVAEAEQELSVEVK